MLTNGARRAIAAIMLVTSFSVPALADVKAGVDAWSRGDYAAAVREWEGPATAGDPDAMFNLAQAYRLGRGVPEDMDRAEVLYARAAQAGHIRAADTLGLLLFQDGRREQALPYVRAAAMRGDPRASYLLGVAHFNGQLVERDWVRAYALVSIASSQGLPQAAEAMREMDAQIPLAQRQEAAGLAIELQQEAQAVRAREFAAAELGIASGGAAVSAGTGSDEAAAGQSRTSSTTTNSPSLAASREAVSQASRAKGTESPSGAGASFASSNAALSAPAPSSRSVVVAAAGRDVTEAAVRTSAVPTSPWRIQLGAFSVRSNAEGLWSRLSGRAELSGKERLMVPAGRVTKLQAGGFASRAEADAACQALKKSGQDCLVTRE